MRCTDCNREVKPVVALDIDGTLGDYHGHFLNFAEAYLGVNRGWAMRYDGANDLATFMGITKDLYREVKLAYRQGGMKRSMPVFDKARELSQALRNQGAEVWITTTRPYLRLDNIDPDTRTWLQRNGIQYDGLIYDADKYVRLAGIVGKERVCGVLEDLPNLFDQAHSLGFQPLFRRTRYNRSIKRFPEVQNLDQAFKQLQVQLFEWRRSNGAGTEGHKSRAHEQGGRGGRLLT